MTTAKTAGVSLASLNARKASETAYEFEYVDTDGNLSGIFLSVIGTHSDTIKTVSEEAEDERRRKDALRAVKAAKSRPDSVEITSVREDIANGTRMIARRLVGWRTPADTEGLTPEQLARFQGIEEPWSPASALELCSINPDIAAQVLENSNELSHFMRVSSPK